MINVQKESFEPLLVGIEVAGRMLNIGRSSVYKLMTSGELPSVTVHCRRLVRMVDLREFVDRLEGAPDKNVEVGGETNLHSAPVTKLHVTIAQQQQNASQAEGRATEQMPAGSTPGQPRGGRR